MSSETPVRVPELDEIEAARQRIAPHLGESPVIEIPLSLPGKRIYVKDEGRHEAGSFKLRSALNAILSRAPERITKGVCTVSSGNMAYAVAVAARIAGVPMAAYMYSHAPQSKIDGVHRNGGQVRFVDDEQYWAFALGNEIPDTNEEYIYPVTDQAVITGHASIGLEIVEQLPEVDLILTPYGAGGLTTGTASAMYRLRHKAEVVAIESEAATPVTAALKAGRPVDVQMRSTFVKAIGGPTVIEGVWQAARQLIRRTSIVSLQQTVDSMGVLFDSRKLVTEGAAATSLAAAINDPSLSGNILCILSGCNIDAKSYGTALLGRVPD